MPPSAPKHRKRRDTGRIARLAVALLALLLIIVNAAAWFLFANSYRIQQQTLRGAMEASAPLVARAMSEDLLFLLNVAYVESTATTNFDTLSTYLDFPSAEAVENSFMTAAGEGEDTNFSMAVLSPAGRVILDRNGFYEPPPAEYAPFAVDVVQFSDADLLTAGEGTEIRVYHALRADDASVVGILALENLQTTGPDYQLLVRRMSASSLVGTILIAFLWITLTRFIKRAEIAERMADQSDRLRAMGTATAGLAHEIRNPLGIMMLTIEELKETSRHVEQEKARGEIDHLLESLAEESARLKSLTDRFLDFARGEPEDERRVIDANQAAGETVKLFAKGTPPHLKVHFAESAEPAPIAFSEGKLRQVLLNLLRNASEAIGDDPGRIKVRVQVHRATVTIFIRDDGPGMDQTTLAQIFDPFFTTRAEGTGLGLSLSRTIVETAGGQLEMMSEKGSGTEARLVFPLAN